MTKFDVDILDLFIEKDIKRVEASISLNEVRTLLPENKRKSQPSVYRHIRYLVKRGYLVEGLRVGCAATYYISSEGVSYCESYHADAECL